jgi:hypothetical protein
MPPRRRWRFEPETHEAIRESETRHLMVTPTAFPRRPIEPGPIRPACLVLGASGKKETDALPHVANECGHGNDLASPSADRLS